MNRLGIEGLQVNRPTAWLIADCVGIPMDINQAWSQVRYDSLAKFATSATRQASYLAFENDPRDTSTPEAMTLLLTKLYTKPVLKPDTQTLLLDIMRRCETGLGRLKGALPPDTEVLHKTGTLGLTASDVGIITLPDNAGHVAISVFVKSSKKRRKLPRTSYCRSNPHYLRLFPAFLAVDARLDVARIDSFPKSRQSRGFFYWFYRYRPLIQ